MGCKNSTASDPKAINPPVNAPGNGSAQQQALDPKMDLIMDKDLAENRFPQIINKFKQESKQSLMAKNIS